MGMGGMEETTVEEQEMSNLEREVDMVNIIH